MHMDVLDRNPLLPFATMAELSGDHAFHLILRPDAN
jgi:hypothetical protein